MSFRTLMLTVVLGLLLVTTLATSFFAFQGTRKAIEQLVGAQTASTLEGVTLQVEALFDPADRILHALRREILSEKFPWDDPVESAKHMGILLRYEEGISWIGFGRADGSFSGAWTDQNRIVLNISSPDGGRPAEWVFEENGELTELNRPEIPEKYDARTRSWFQIAKDAPDMVWSKPYDFESGGRGISACLAVHDTEGVFLGVLTVDFTLADIAAYLDKLAQEFSSEALVFSLNGELLAMPEAASDTDGLNAVQQVILQLTEEERDGLGGDQLIRLVRLEGDTVMIGMRAAKVAGDLDCISTVVSSRNKNFGWLDQLMRNTWLAAAAALLIALVAGFLLAGRVADPLRKITGQLQRIGDFELDSPPHLKSSIREIRSLVDSLDRMRSSLRSFSHYVPVELVQELVRAGGKAEPGGEKRHVTILFCDMAGFTTYAETVSPEVSVDTLTVYFESIGKAVESHGGIIDKFLGDGIMALFNAPANRVDHEAAACAAALDALKNLPSGPSRCLGVRLGIHCGQALVGNIGTTRRFAYTAIGDCVNLASRIEGLGKIYGVPILASELIRKAAGEERFLWRTLDRVAVVGREEAIPICQLVGWRTEATASLLQTVADYESALAETWKGNFGEALRLLKPHVDADPPANFLTERLKTWMQTPPPEGWSGTFRSEQK